MFAFIITHASDKKSYKFSDINKLTEVIKSSYSQLDFSEEPLQTLQNSDDVPDYSCVKHNCWLLPEKFQHVYRLKFQCENLDDMPLVVSIYQGFCKLSGYTFQLIPFR